LRLLASGDWVSRAQLSRIPSATARVRDLRKDELGGFPVECKSSLDLGKSSAKRTFYYRINPTKVSKKQIETLFKQAI